MNLSSAVRGRPKLLAALRGYDRRKAIADLTAGVTVGLVALPLAMAFAISSGLTPQAGIYTAIVAGGLISLLGGSRLQIGGPTGAFVVIVAGIVAAARRRRPVPLHADGRRHARRARRHRDGIGGAVHPTAGRRRIHERHRGADREHADSGFLRPATSTTVPGEFLPRMQALARASGRWSPLATALAVGALGIILVANRVSKRIPGASSRCASGPRSLWRSDLPVETIGTRFGGIPSGLPALHLPQFRLELLGTLIVPAMTVAMLGAIESLMSAMVADRMSGDRHDSNVELVAQGVANIASPLFGGLPATGAIARTATNIRSGAQTPVAGIVHALTLVVILLFAAPLARYVPLAVLAGILMVVAYNMGEWAEIPELLRLTKTDVMVWIVTFALTVFADLTEAVGVGMVCAALLFIKRVADTTTVTAVTDDYVQDGHVHSLQNQTIPPYVRIFRIHGPFLFGATDKLRPRPRRRRRASADRHPAPSQHDRARRDRPARVRGARAGAAARRAARCSCAARATSPPG